MKSPISSAVLRAIIGIGCLVGLIDGSASAETLRIQGSSQLVSQVLLPYQDRIENAAGYKLNITSSKASLGLLALFDGEADLAMVSAQVKDVVAFLQKTTPDLPYRSLRGFLVGQTRVAYPVNPDNPVRRITSDQLKQILSGQIDNWREFGGPDLPIRIVSLSDGGGARITIKNVLLGGEQITSRAELRLESMEEVVDAVAQDRGALGIADSALLRRKGLPELTTETVVEQPLYLVSLGEPSDAMSAVITAARRAMFEDNP